MLTTLWTINTLVQPWGLWGGKSIYEHCVDTPWMWGLCRNLMDLHRESVLSVVTDSARSKMWKKKEPGGFSKRF
jgi:hypothetical protein